MIFDWQDLINHIFRFKKQLTLANTLALGAALLSIPIPLLLPLLIDELILHHPGKIIPSIQHVFAGNHSPIFYLVIITGLTVFLRLATLLLNIIQTRQFTLISKHIVSIIRNLLLTKLERMSMYAYEALGSGKVANHFTVDIQTIDSFISDALRKFVTGVITLISVLIVLGFIHWYLLLFLIILNPMVILFTKTIGKRIKALKRQENHAFEIFQTSLVETLDAMQQIRISNRSQYFFAILNKQSEAIKISAGSYAWKSDTASRLSSVIFMMGFDLFRAGALLLVLFSDLTIGQMLGAFSYLWVLMGSMQEILDVQYSYYSAKAALERINSMATLEEQPKPIIKRYPFTDTPPYIEINRLSFSYQKDFPIFQEFSLSIQPGEKIGLIASSGSGKSTLIQLLLGMYQANSGTICYNHVPIQQIDLADLHQQIACVLQHPALLNESIRHNLTLGVSLPDQALYEAIEKVQLGEFLKQQPKGLDTHIGTRGIRLSGGQKQRLAIARILLTQPQVVILDEATSALDVTTEKLVFGSLTEFFQNKTVIISAHRESALAATERRVYLNQTHSHNL